MACRIVAWFGTVSFLAAFVTSVVATSLPAQSRIKLGTLAPTGTSYHQILQEMREKIRTCPGGGLRMTIYAGGVLGGEPDHVRKMRVGQINAAMLTTSGLAEIDPSVNALQKMPMMFRSLEELEYVRSHLEDALAERLLQKGFVVLFWGDAGWVHFFSRDAGFAPDDFRRMKMWVGASDAEQIDLLRKAGLQVVPLEIADVLTALRTGIVDALPTLPFYALTGQFYTVTHHMLEVKWIPLTGATVMTERAWRRMRPEAQACLEKVAAAAGQRIEASSRRENREAVVAMQEKHGLHVHPVSAELEAEWRRESEKFYPDIRGSIVPADLFDEVRRLLAEYRALHAQPVP